MKFSHVLLLVMATTAVGCYYDSEEELYNCSADPATTRYATTISNILTSYGCTSCHGAFAPAAGISLNTHAGVKAMAESGRLFGAINHQPGFEPMPQGSAKMSGCDIRKIKAWIDAGAPDN